MRNLVLFGLIISLLTLNSTTAMPLQLSGTGGQAILTNVASTNISIEVGKATPEDLWSWGKIPMNYCLNTSGKLIEQPSIDEDNMWLEARINEVMLNLSEYR
ncbi:Uncharacterised protein [uncultured archaeon]|nr:Uncharacterised protein [uncultured archaeon]